jgi:thiol:disulfide interchange protein DsbD
MAAWLYGQWQPRGWRFTLLGAGTTAMLVLALGPVTKFEPLADAEMVSEEQTWSEEQVRRLTAEGRPVFVNFTAAWCITCKVNEQVALTTDDTQRLFRDRSIAYLVADWTRRDLGITRQLQRHGRSGVPLYLLYSPEGEQPIMLPQLLTETIVADAINQL